MRSAVTTIIVLCILSITSHAAIPDSVMLRVLEVERQIMSADDSAKTELLLKKAAIYKNYGEYTSALSTLDRISAEASTNKVKLEKAFNYFFTEEYSSALHEIWSIKAVDELPADGRILYLMVLLENEHCEEFKLSLKHEYQRASLDTTGLFNGFAVPDGSLQPKISVIPGAALFKYGYPGKAILNISLQMLFAGFGVYELSHGLYSTATFSGFLTARRFYSGGRRLAKSLARQSVDENINNTKKKGYQLIAPLLY